MAQKTAWTGAALTESDINTYLMHEGGAWTSYTPTLTQSATPTKTVTYARYARAGRLIIGNVSLAVTSAGTAGNRVVIGLPVATNASVVGSLGAGYIFDASAGLIYSGDVFMNTSTTVGLWGGGGVADALGVVQFAAALASGDIVSVNFCYEAAS